MVNLQVRLKAQALLASQVIRVTEKAIENGVRPDDVVQILQEVANDVATPSFAQSAMEGQ